MLAAHDDGLTREDSKRLYFECPMEKMFDVKETALPLPEPARHLESIVCEGCGETVAENYIHLQNGKKLCRDCYTPYRRFDV